MKEKYTKEYCKLLAQQCQSRADFKRLNSEAYRKALTKKWLDEFGLFHESHIKWTREACFDAATKCRTITEFITKYNAAYRRSKICGWLDDIKFQVPRHVSHRSDDEIILCAKQYTSYSDFYKKERGMYGLAHKRGLLNSFTWLKRRTDFNKDIHDNIYVYEFKDYQTAYVGRTINPERRHAEHSLYEHGSVYQFAISHNCKIPDPIYVYKNVNIKDGPRLEGETITKYKTDGWVLLNKAPAGSMGALTEYSKSTCINIAKQYQYKTDLKMTRPEIYSALLRHKWMKECTWLKSYKRKWDTLTFDEFKALVNNYRTRSEISCHNHALYNIGLERGWLDMVLPAKITPKPVIQYNLDGTFIAEYKSVGEASLVTGCDTDRIIACCKHRQRYTHHYKFEYKDAEK